MTLTRQKILFHYNNLIVSKQDGFYRFNGTGNLRFVSKELSVLLLPMRRMAAPPVTAPSPIKTVRTLASNHSLSLNISHVVSQRAWFTSCPVIGILS
jgi:hypothetical protein